MSKKILKISVFIVVLLSLSVVTISAQKNRGVKNSEKKSNTDTKKIVVIMNFNDSSLSQEDEKREMGKQMAVYLSNEFTRRQNYIVVERKRIEELLKEQNASFDGRYDRKLAAKIGKVLSPNTIVFGEIIKYSTKKTGISIGGIGNRKYEATVGLIIRLVDVDTGEIKESVKIEGKANEGSIQVGLYSGGTELTSEVRTAILTEAALEAVKKGADELIGIIENPGQERKKKKKKRGMFGSIFGGGDDDDDDDKKEELTSDNSSSVPTIAVKPTVVSVSKDKVYIKGDFSSYKIGDQLVIYRITNEIKDPDSGEVLGVETKDIAKVEIVNIQKKLIITKVVTGQKIEVKDLVKKP